LTVGEFVNRYLKTYVGKRVTEDGTVEWSGQYLRPQSARQADYQRRQFLACAVPAAGGTMPVEQKPLAGVTKADIEAMREARRLHGVIACKRLLARLRHLFNWAIGEGFTEQTPFKRHGVSVVKLETAAESSRTRRLEPGDEEPLLKHASPHLRAMIVAALSTGCRVGELLSLQWQQIRYDEHGTPRWIVVPAAKTKTNTARVLQIVPRLSAELAMRRHASDGKEHPLDAYVFGDETGAKVASIKRAWEVAALHAHGHTPVWANRAELRRQFACTLLESFADLHDVRDFSATRTSRPRAAIWRARWCGSHGRSRESILRWRSLPKVERPDRKQDPFANHSHKRRTVPNSSAQSLRINP
jgi:integrase